jgi:protein-tyrosine-phosphatase
MVILFINIMVLNNTTYLYNLPSYSDYGCLEKRKMTLEKIITVCAGNGGRSVIAESVVQRLVQPDMHDFREVMVYGRGIYADMYNQMFSKDGEMDEKYVKSALERYKRFKTNFSQNIVNMIDQGADEKEIAKAIFNEERADYIRQIKRYCDESILSLPYPKAWHQQLVPEEITEGTTIILALDHRVKDWIKENKSELKPYQYFDISIEDELGGDYEYRKSIWEKIHRKVSKGFVDACNAWSEGIINDRLK